MRPVWKGWMSFGLIHIPVNLYSGTKQQELKFHLLHKKDKSPIRYARICKKDGKEIPWDEIVKGYTLESGDVVILTEADFEKANLERVKSIQILDFVQTDEIPTSYYKKPYILEPQKGAGKAYILLRDALSKTKKVGLCKFVLRNREHLGAILVEGDLILLNQMRFANELIQKPELKIPKKEKISKKEVEMAIKLIDHLTEDFEPKQYKDEYRKEILSVIKKKSKGKTVRKKGKAPKKTKQDDFLKVLKKSLKDSAA